MTAEQLALDAEPDWETDSWDTECEPSDRPPTPGDLRRAEIRDMRRQGPGPRALWTAHTVPTGSYL